MASQRGFEPPTNSLGSYYWTRNINHLLRMRHIFATWISNQHARLVFLLAMNQSRGFVFEYGELPSRVKAIIQRAMCVAYAAP